MAISPKVLKAHGCTPKDWKPLFTARADKKLLEIKKLELLIMNRRNDGLTMNMRDYRIHAAIDLAWDAAFQQTTPTIINSLVGRKYNKPEDLRAALTQWGLNPDDIFLKSENPKTGRTEWSLNVPTFYKIVPALMRAYVTIRQAKLFNDRNQTPLFKYDPIQVNAETRILTDVLTYVIQVMTADFGYANDLKQAILQALKYSYCLMFPREVWWASYQAEEKSNEEGFEKEQKTLQKEGIRYFTPRPTHCFWDLHYNLSSVNNDTGCEYGGYWKVVSYGDIMDNPLYWNRRSIGYGSGAAGDWYDPVITNQFFQEVYPCALDFPLAFGPDQSSRETNAAFYCSSDRDRAVFQTDMYMKIIPARYKMGTYKYPIWVRFVVANDNTVLYAEPCCYSPMIYFGYDADQLNSRNPSLALEVLPYQDMIGNVLSQILLTIKQNLANVTFYDTNILNRDDIDKVKNGGELLFRGLNFVGFDSMKNNRAGWDVDKALHEVNFQAKDVAPMFQEITTILGILERMLQLSAQEAGQAASHQQSKEEVQMTGAATSNRVMYTGSFIDDGIDAWKRQLYDASQAYMDDEVEAMVPSDIPDIEEHLETLGFTLSGAIQGEGKKMVKGSKKAIKLDAFASSGKGPERKNEQQTAQVMMQAVSAVAANQQLAQAVGPKTLLKIIQQAAILAGADKDFRLRPDQKAQLDALNQMAQQIIADATQAATQKVEQDVTKPVAQEIAAIQAQVEKLTQVLTSVVPASKAALTPPTPPPNAPQTGNQPAPSAPTAAPQPTA